jgi:hypothetical protein
MATPQEQVEDLIKVDKTDDNGYWIGKHQIPYGDPKDQYLAQFQDAQRKLGGNFAQVAVLEDLRAGKLEGETRYDRPGETKGEQLYAQFQFSDGQMTAGSFHVAARDVDAFYKQVTSDPEFARKVEHDINDREKQHTYFPKTELPHDVDPAVGSVIKVLDPDEHGNLHAGLVTIDQKDAHEVRERLMAGGPDAKNLAEAIIGATSKETPITFDPKSVPEPPQNPEIANKDVRATLAGIPDARHGDMAKKVESVRSQSNFEREAARATAEHRPAAEFGTDLMVNGSPKALGGSVSGRLSDAPEIKDGVVTIHTTAGGRPQDISAPEQSALGQELAKAGKDDYVRVAVGKDNNFSLERKDPQGVVVSDMRGGPDPDKAPQLARQTEAVGVGRG